MNFIGTEPPFAGRSVPTQCVPPLVPVGRQVYIPPKQVFRLTVDICTQRFLILGNCSTQVVIRHSTAASGMFRAEMSARVFRPSITGDGTLGQAVPHTTIQHPLTQLLIS